jgi:hypothetical protein
LLVLGLPPLLGGVAEHSPCHSQHPVVYSPLPAASLSLGRAIG